MGKSNWQPEKSRVFMVSMTRFKGGTPAPWGTKERNDGDFIKCLKAKGVPEDKIEFLTHEQADSDSLRQHLDDFLSKRQLR